jgi:hypothetical protein
MDFVLEVAYLEGKQLHWLQKAVPFMVAIPFAVGRIRALAVRFQALVIRLQASLVVHIQVKPFEVDHIQVGPSFEVDRIQDKPSFEVDHTLDKPSFVVGHIQAATS